jgi:hypothetical protein
MRSEDHNQTSKQCRYDDLTIENDMGLKLHVIEYQQESTEEKIKTGKTSAVDFSIRTVLE